MIFDTDERVHGDPLVEENFARIVALFAGRAEVFRTLHTDKSGSRKPDDGRTLRLSSRDIFGAFPHRKGEKIIPGNSDLKVVATAGKLPDFDHFIRFEYDVWHNNPSPAVLDTLHRLATSNVFATAHVRRQEPSDDWPWWDSLQSPDGMPVGDAMAAFLPMMVVSRSFLERYREELIRGWTGHWEVLMPTLAARLGIEIVDLESRGVLSNADFVAHANRRPRQATGAFVHPVKVATDRPQWASDSFRSAIGASAAEIDEMAAQMWAAGRYLQYGSGGTARLALDCGVQRVTTVGTDLELCRQSIDAHDLRLYIDVGRLVFRHIEMGPTAKWGYPKSPPLERQIEEYLAVAAESPFDLCLIDGRYRVAAAAAAYLACPTAVIMIHDYSSRPIYHVIEEFLRPTKTVGDLTVFAGISGREAEASAIRQKYVSDPH